MGLLLASKINSMPTSLQLNMQRESKLLILLLKAITLANVVKFFLLPIMIWNNHTGDMEKKFNFTLVMGYFVYGLIHVYSGRFRALHTVFQFQYQTECPLIFDRSGVESTATHHRRIYTDHVGNQSDSVQSDSQFNGASAAMMV